MSTGESTFGRLVGCICLLAIGCEIEETSGSNEDRDRGESLGSVEQALCEELSQGTPPLDDLNPCTEDLCDSTLGITHPPRPSGWACDDATVCNGHETCDGTGTCSAGTPLVVDDLNDCSEDACDSSAGVSHTPSAAGSACDDGDGCTTEACDGAGTCDATAIAIPSDDVECTIDSCDSASGEFYYEPDEGAACDDEDPCTGAGTCDATGACLAGATLPSDNDECTIETCGPTGIETATCAEVDPTVTSTLADGLAFLYTGSNPVQVGVTAGAIDELHAAAVVGRVFQEDGQPFIGAAVRVIGHPELGSTPTDLEGRYVLVANGGAPLTVAIEADGFLPAQRTVLVTAQMYGQPEDVILVPLDESETEVHLDLIDEIAVAAGSIVTDADGSRQAIVMFTPGTSALLELPDGTTQAANTLTMRVTEYTQGTTGPERMPASLPPTSGYTYAVEISADEAIAAGASGILLSEPVSFFLDNFIGLPVGIAVPVGTYDRVRGLWVPGPDGVVLEIVSTAGGIAAVDVTGDGLGEDDTVLEAYGLSQAEREDLASRYAAGTQLWHGELSHFSPCDFNFPMRLLPDACVPLACGPGDPALVVHSGQDPESCTNEGSVIECTNQALGESVSVAGTGHSLHYRSSRTRGTPRSVTFPISGPSLPSSLIAIRARVRVAGQVIEEQRTCPCASNESVTLTWDGTDLFGRQLAGAQPAVVEIAYDYPANYAAGTPTTTGNQFVRSFATWSGTNALNLLSRESIEVIQRKSIQLGGLYNGSHGLGGYSLDVVHAYDVLGRALYRGDGTQRQSDEVRSAFKPLRTAPAFGYSSIATMANNDLVYSANSGRQVYRRAADGTETLIANSLNVNCQPGDGPALGSCLINGVHKLLPAPDGSIYAKAGQKILRIVPGGNVTRVAGIDGGGSSADGIPATEAGLPYISALAMAPDGSVYVAHDQTIRRIGPDGTIRTVAGVGGYVDGGNGGPASLAGFGSGITGIAFGPDGSLYVVHGIIGGVFRVRRIRPDGIVVPIAGYGSQQDQTGLLALDALNTRLEGPNTNQIAVGRDGTVYLRDELRIQNAYQISSIRAISGGKLRTVAGASSACQTGSLPCGVGGPAVAAGLISVGDLHTAPDGTVRAFNDQFAYAVVPELPHHGKTTFMVAEEDGRTVHRFDASGRHLETLDAQTLAVIYSMSYDAAGLLSSVTDVDGLTTTIERDTLGEPTAIVGPYGHATSLTLDADGYLASIKDPTGEAWSATYQPNGLMTSWTNRDGHTANFQWNAAGQLIQHQHPGGGFMTLARTNTPTGHQVTITSPLGRATTYKREHDAAATETRRTTLPSGLAPVASRKTNGQSTTTMPDGTQVTRLLVADSRWGMESPVPSSTVTRLPSALSRTTAVSRSFTPSNFTDPLLITAHTETRTINGRAWTSNYNTSTKIQTVTSPAGRVSRSTLDAKGRVIKSERPDVFDVNYAYDVEGRIDSITQGTRVTSRDYGADGLVNLMTDALSQQTTLSRNLRGDVLTEMRPDLEVTAYGYDGEGHTTQVTPPEQPTHALTFNAIGQLDAYNPPNLGFPDVTTYDYDLDKKLELITQPGPRLISYDYDAAGRVDEINFPNGIVSRTYSPTTGQLTAIDGPDGVNLDMTYDGSLLKSLVWSGDVAGTVAWTHDTDFRPITEKVNGAWTTSFGYDVDSLLTSAGALTLSRDVESGRVNTAASSNVSETLTYNSYGEVQTKTSSYSGTPFLELSYVRDDLGRITQKTETLIGVTTVSVYDYDEVGRLLTVHEDGTLVESYSYDPNGNRTSALNSGGVFGASYDDQDRIIGYGSNLEYAFRDNGELFTRTDTTTNDVTAYEYDAVGNLRGVTLPNGDVIEYLVDGSGRRVGKTVNGVFEKGWLWRGKLQPVAELDSAGAVAKRFVYAGGVNVPELMITSTATYRLAKDHLGSVRLVIDVATGAIAQELQYDAWGRVLVDTAPGFQPSGFAGGLYDADTGLVRFGARDYDAEIGRWTAKDPLRFDAGGPNLYEPFLGDPVNVIDADGLRPERLRRWTPEYFDRLLDVPDHRDYDEYDLDDPRCHRKFTALQSICGGAALAFAGFKMYPHAAVGAAVTALSFYLEYGPPDMCRKPSLLPPPYRLKPKRDSDEADED